MAAEHGPTRWYSIAGCFDPCFAVCLFVNELVSRMTQNVMCEFSWNSGIVRTHTSEELLKVCKLELLSGLGLGLARIDRH